MKKLAVLIFILLLVSFSYLFYSLTLSKYIEAFQKSQSSKDTESIHADTDENSLLDENFPSQQDSIQATGGAGTISEEPAPVQELDENGCFSSTVSYSLGSFQENSTCLEYEREICVKKIVTCSVAVNNLDDEVSGEFEVTFNFINGKFMIDTGNEAKNIAPNSQEIFESSKEFKDELATTEISCSTQISNVPSKTICPN